MSGSFLLTDLGFNFAALFADLLVVLAIRAHRDSRISTWSLAGATIVIPILLPVVAYEIAGYTGLGFLMMRLLGMIIFWHFPLVLIAGAVIRRKKKLPALAMSLGGAILLGVYVFAYHVEPYRLEISHYEFTDERLNGLKRPVVIAQMADLQTDRIGKFERRVMRELAAAKPDMIVWVGDFVHVDNPEQFRSVSAKMNELFRAELPDSPFGMWAVNGDVDGWSPDLSAFFAGTPTRVLDDETVIADLGGAKVNLIGLNVGTSRARRYGDLSHAWHGRDPDLLDIYLGHAPDFVRALASQTAPFLALAGHTHGGQVQLPFYGPIMTLSHLPRKFADDFLPYGAGVLSVSRGLGMERVAAPRLRFLCRPEIRLVTLRGPDTPRDPPAPANGNARSE